MTCPDVNVLDIFYEEMQARLAMLRKGRPKKLRVFINPVGGKRKGMKLFEGCRGLFAAAGVELDVRPPPHPHTRVYMPCSHETADSDADDDSLDTNARSLLVPPPDCRSL